LKTKAIGYWETTAILALVVLSGDLAELAHGETMSRASYTLAYPLHFVTIIGLWKVLGG
jgi:hypothetical protein